MKKEDVPRLPAADLIVDIIERGILGAPGMLNDIVLMVGEELSAETAKLMAKVRHLKEQRASLHPGQSAEDARRRLQNPKLVTSHPAERASTLLAQRLELVQQVVELVQRLFVPLAKLQMVDAELEALREVLAELEVVRQRHRETGLYHGGANFLSRLHENYNVDWRDLECLSEEQDQEIADIILRRYRAAQQKG